MSYALTLAGIAAANLLAAASPGPAFVLVSRAAITHDRVTGWLTGLGVASASFTWAVAATLGLGVLLAQVGWLYTLMKLMGGAYLVWVGVQAILHARAPLTATGAAGPAMNRARAWRTGYTAGMTNPKVIVFFGSIFLTLFGPDTPLWVRIAALVVVAFDETFWYSLVATVFSTHRARAVYGHAKTWVDRIAGGVMLAFGLRLIATARR